ncbi:MAG: lactate racemase domain-containing protein [Bryobacterales bacterium]
MRLQKVVPIKQHFPDLRLANVAGAVRQSLEEAKWTKAVSPGSRIAVGAGSRGISNIDVIVRAVVDFWKSRGVHPFVIPVMGSHGAATAEGQADVLAHYGITEQTMGAPVISSLDVVDVGTTPEGIEVVMDRQAFESDGVMVCGRVKWHTDFGGKLESGIHKMMAIGLGKWAGARRYHSWALRIGMEQVIRGVGGVILGTGKMLGGLAILEDAYHNTAELHALGANGMAKQEEELLERAKSWKPNVPVAETDLLIIDEMGKNISGAGMDTKVINRSVDGPNLWPGVPLIRRIFVRDLSSLSYGNAVGMGFADIISDRLFEKIDFNPTWINGLTASTTQPAFTPMHFANDRTCIDKVIATCGKLDVSECSIVWIRNTLELGELMVSENLLEELARNPDIEIAGAPQELPFDSDGNLVSMFAAEAVAH